MKNYLVEVTYADINDQSVYAAQGIVRAQDEREAEHRAAEKVCSYHDWMVSIISSICLGEDKPLTFSCLDGISIKSGGINIEKANGHNENGGS